jgi:hypothetical protein
MEAYVKFIIIKRVAGGIAILATVCYILRSLSSAIDNSTILIMLALILCSVYSFSSIAKNKDYLFGISAVILTVHSMWNIIGAMRLLPFIGDFSGVLARFTVIFGSYALIGIIFLLISLRYFGVIKLNVKIMPIIVFALAFLRILFMPHGGYNTFIIIAFEGLYLTPFLLITLFSPPMPRLQKKVKRPQEQKAVTIGDINSQQEQKAISIGTAILHNRNTIIKEKVY